MRIGIIGASSQVGSSIAFYFKKFTEVEVVCFVRSPYSQVFFTLFDIEYDSIDLDAIELLKEKCKDLDAVIDCSFPAGQSFEIPSLIKKNLANIISSMKKDSVFIYMSSIMAYGMPADEKYIRDMAIPRTFYAYTKRLAEETTVRLCKQHSIKGYNFRLGQVHGFLQSVNASFREKLTFINIASVNGREDDLTNTIFINSVCTAITKCLENKINPGLYTLVSHPQWTLNELYTYYIDYYNLPVKIVYINNPNGKRQSKGSLKNFLIGKLMKYRPLLETYILMRLPALSIKAKGRYREVETRKAITYKNDMMRFIDFNLLGRPPKEIITDIHSEVERVSAIERKSEELYNEILNFKRI